MIKELYNTLLYGSRVFGIEHTTNSEGDYIYISDLKKRKNEITLLNTYKLNIIEDISSSVQTNSAITLVINTDHVITKTVISEKQDFIKLVQLAYPKINTSDFYIEITHQNQNHFISICRKSYIDKILKDYSEIKLNITYISLGNNICSLVLPYIKDTELQTSNAYITIEDDSIVEIKSKHVLNNYKYNIEGLKTTSEFILSASVALNGFINTHNSVTNFDKLKNDLLNTFKQTQFFKKGIAISLTFFIITLLGNTFAFQHYFTKIDELQSSVQFYETKQLLVDSLQKDISKTEKIVNDMLNNNSSRSSFFINIIVQSLPEHISLNTINYQPLSSRIKQDQPIYTYTNTIILSGQTQNNDLLSLWISELEGNNWCKTISILGYNATSKNMSTFEIKINIENVY